jgi:hypothetical protein
MERNQDATPEPQDDFVDRVRGDLDRADGDGDEARLETLERIRGDLEAELDSSLENRTTGR